MKRFRDYYEADDESPRGGARRTSAMPWIVQVKLMEHLDAQLTSLRPTLLNLDRHLALMRRNYNEDVAQWEQEVDLARTHWRLAEMAARDDQVQQEQFHLAQAHAHEVNAQGLEDVVENARLQVEDSEAAVRPVAMQSSQIARELRTIRSMMDPNQVMRLDVLHPMHGRRP